MGQERRARRKDGKLLAKAKYYSLNPQGVSSTEFSEVISELLEHIQAVEGERISQVSLVMEDLGLSDKILQCIINTPFKYITEVMYKELTSSAFMQSHSNLITLSTINKAVGE